MYSSGYQRDALQEVLKMVNVKELKKANGKIAFRSAMMERFDLVGPLTQRGVPVRVPGMDDPTQR